MLVIAITAFISATMGFGICAMLTVGKLSEQEQCKRCGYRW